MAKNSELKTHPMKSIVDAWLEKIKLALEVRHEKFGKYAEEISRFYDGPHDFMWQNDYAKGRGGFLDKESGVLPTFRVTINEVFEAVALFGPALYHKNPNVLVSPLLPAEIAPEALGIDPNDPYGMQEYQMLAMEEQKELRVKEACAAVKSQYINWVQQETDKKTHARRTIQESIVTGLGYLETTIYQPPSSNLVMPRSTYVSWYDVVIDPDASYWEDVQWIAIRRDAPVNKTEERFGYEAGELRGHMQSFESQASKRGRKEARENRKGKSFDLTEYWEVFSKNGFGDRLNDAGTIPRHHNYDYSVLGDNCWIAVAKDIPFPLNCPTTSLLEEDAEALFDRVQWPVPFWYDIEAWPISRLTFYEKENCVWPISMFKPAIGEMRFINWCMSFLADKVAASCTTYVGMMKAAGAQIQKQIGDKNTPFTVIEIAEALGIKNINEAISFIQAPNFPGDIWKMLAEVGQRIKEKTGVTELLHGLTSRSMRSAAEANIKNERVSVRPDDMAARTEDFLSEVAVREIQAAGWFCTPEHVQPVVGRMGAMVWQNYVMTGDPEDVVRNYTYRVEAGSTRKPNKDTKIQQLNELAQFAGQVFAEQVAMGNVEQFNAFMREWCRNADIDHRAFMIQPPQVQGPSPEEQKAQAEMQKMQAEMAAKQSEFTLEVAKMREEFVIERERLGLDKEKHEQELKFASEKHKADMKHDEAKARQDIEIGRSKAKAAAKPKPAARK